MLTRLAWVILVLSAPPSSAMAAQATIANVSVNLPAPAGFCELSPNNAADNRVLKPYGDVLSATGNRLLAMSTDCGQLIDFRAGKRAQIDNSVVYQTTSTGTANESIEQTCSTLRAEGEKILSKVVPDIKARSEQAIKNLKINETSFVGVLAEEPTACYGALLQKLRVGRADEVDLKLFAGTIIKNNNVFVYRIVTYADSTTVTKALAELKAIVAALYAANK